MDVSVIIVSYNTRDLTLACLRSVFAQTQGIDFEVIVVDNASRDGTAAAVACAFPQVLLLANADNRGFAAANNQGLARARGRFVLLLNPDTVVLDGAVQKTVAFADGQADAAVVGCQVLLDQARIQPTCFSFPGPLSVFLAYSGLSRLLAGWRWFGWPELGWWDRRTLRDVDVVSGMFMLVRREAIDQVGTLDEAYFVYGEETDWCHRFAKAGWRRVFWPGARIIHVDGGGKSTRQVSAPMYVQLQRSLLIFARKNLGWWRYTLMRLVFGAVLLPRLAFWAGRAVVSRSPRSRNLLACVWGAAKLQVAGVQP